MRNTIIFIILGLVLIILVIGLFQYFFQKPKPITSLTQPTSMRLFSPVFQANQLIPKKYTCDGEDISPPLKIEGVPNETKSLVLIVDDPDAPVDTWNHWLVWNIDPKTEEIKENSVPEKAILGSNDFAKLDYGGPCPPSGVHRYVFKIYALDTLLNLRPGAKKTELMKAMTGHILTQGELIGRYGR